jgi:hypothetical protein
MALARESVAQRESIVLCTWAQLQCCVITVYVGRMFLWRVSITSGVVIDVSRMDWEV